MKKLIPDCYYPGTDQGSYVSHEAICILNTSDKTANISLTLYFEDREKISGFRFTVSAERTKHMRMDQAVNPEGIRIPRQVPYAVLVESDIDVAVQYTRVDTTQAELALMTAVIS